jgi:hypothetical protein
MLPILLAMSSHQPTTVEFKGQDVAFRAVRSSAGEWIEELSAKDSKGAWRTILVTPTFPGIAMAGDSLRATAIEGPGDRLFRSAPTLALTSILQRKEGGRTVFTLTRKENGAEFTRTVAVPNSGKLVRIEQTAAFPRPRTPIRYFLCSYAFAPDGRPLSKGGKPDSTFSPGLRPGDAQVVGDHFFRAPVIVAQKGPLAALMMPDLDVLENNRPIPTLLDLDAANGVVDAALMSYGFADYRLVGHVYFAQDASLIRTAPKELRMAFDLLLTATAEPYGAYREALPLQWEKYGRENFDKVLPQAMPFAEYAEYCYPRVFEEAYGNNKLGWFEVEIDGKICGGIPSGWGFTSGWVSWQAWFNQLRSAWGLRWWGKKVGKQDWVDKADKMLNLALAAPMDRGAVPTTYLSREKQWKGSLIMPDPSCYYDLTNMAWKGIWMLRWLEFEDCPRREEVVGQVHQMAQLMVDKQNPDGSFPSWLNKDLAVVPVLDRSAQSALPTWFLAEASRSPSFEMPTMKGQNKAMSSQSAQEVCRRSAQRGTDFLVANVVDQQRWYDFETFFSCSPKTCLQRNSLMDDPKMHDAHTLSPPQNTLSMQWTAEALFAVSNLLPEQDAKYRAAALKALDIMALYQNVWSLPWIKAAYTFGGFGVQNSDGEFLDARQSQFGCTLADFGAALGRRDYFERGVAAVRASMTLINHPLHAENGLYPNPNYPPGLQPENTGHGGTDQQNGRTGFDWGEGSGLAGMAWLLHKYGSTYKAPDWTVLVDGGIEGQRHFPKPLVLADPVFDLSDWRMPGWDVRGNFAEVPTYSTRMSFGLTRGEPFFGTCEDGRGGFDDSYMGTIESPIFTSSKNTLKLMVGGGSGEGVYVELLDMDADPKDGKRIYLARGKNAERMEEVAWDLASFRGRRLKLRIVDRETGGWGHINVGRIRVSD